MKKENKLLKKGAMAGKVKGSLVEKTKKLQKKIEAEMEGLAELELDKGDFRKDGGSAEEEAGKTKADASKLKKL